MKKLLTKKEYLCYNIDTIKRAESSERKVVFIMLRGFTFFLNGKDYFVETSRTNKTQNLAAEILHLLGYSVTEGNIKALLFRLKKATCEIKIAENADRKEKRYFEISGEGFGGCGGWIDDGSTVILKIN